ncbi:hypothetical protein D9M69_394210 [compost metagenome]
MLSIQVRSRAAANAGQPATHGLHQPISWLVVDAEAFSKAFRADHNIRAHRQSPVSSAGKP